MALFKSKDERRMERNIKIKKAINTIKRQLKDLEKNQGEYLEKAKRAKQIGSNDQLGFLRKTIKKTMSQRIMLERQLLNLETAVQIKNQAESHTQFAVAMNAVSKSIAEMFGATDLAKTQVEFEKAIEKAETIEERMNLFLDMSSESMFGYESSGSEELVTDAEIDRMISDEAVHAETKTFDREIQDGLSEIREELKKDV